MVADKIVAVANSKRGFYFTMSFNPTAAPNQTAKMSYSDPATFWNPSTVNQNVDKGLNSKILRLDNPSLPADSNIYFLLLRKDAVFNYNVFSAQIRANRLSEYVESYNIMDTHVQIWRLKCNRGQSPDIIN